VLVAEGTISNVNWFGNMKTRVNVTIEFVTVKTRGLYVILDMAFRIVGEIETPIVFSFVPGRES
jgi:hypothetical protein